MGRHSQRGFSVGKPRLGTRIHCARRARYGLEAPSGMDANCKVVVDPFSSDELMQAPIGIESEPVLAAVSRLSW